MEATIQKWGNSQGLRLTKIILKEIELTVGDKVNIIAEKEKLIIKPIKKKRKRFDINELVKDIPHGYKVNEEWRNNVGKEEW